MCSTRALLEALSAGQAAFAHSITFVHAMCISRRILCGSLLILWHVYLSVRVYDMSLHHPALRLQKDSWIWGQVDAVVSNKS